MAKNQKKKEIKTNIFHRRLGFDYPRIKKGRGIYLWDSNGKKYIDAVGGAIVANLGHGIKEIAKDMERLASRFSYLHGAQFITDDMEQYAKELCQVAPKNLSKVLFVTGGSEGIETAIKLAKQYHYDTQNKKKYQVIRRAPAYHGNTLLALSLTSKEGMRRPQQEYLLDFPAIPAPYCYRCPFGKNYPSCGLLCAKALETAIKKEGPENVSAFIAEPVIGASIGAVVPPKEYFPLISKICKKYNVLLVMDEVMAGFGRTGKWFACQHWNFEPDIVVVSKGIAGGFAPLTAVFCTEKILQGIKNGSGNFSHGFTFENNPFLMGVGYAVLKYIKKNNLVRASEQKGKYLLKKLQELKSLDIVGDARGLGLMTALEFVEDKKTKKPFARKQMLSEKIVQAAMKKGLNLYFAVGFVKGGDGDAIMVAPPYNVSFKEIDLIVKIFKEAIIEAKNNLK